MKVLMFSPGFPAEMPWFTRGLARVGAEVYGLGDQPAAMIPAPARHALTDYIRVPHLWKMDALLDEVRQWHEKVGFDRIECLWEPGMILAAQLREALGLPGMTVEETIPFRDKTVMKQRLEAAGIRTPHHGQATSRAEVEEIIGRIGYPICVKPVAGAGSKDTYRLDDDSDLARVMPKLRHLTEISVEEYIEGEEHTFDTICADGRVHYSNIAWYRPRPLIARTEEWISPQTVTLRNVEAPHLASGRKMGFEVLRALGFRTGFTHMEWFLKPDGEAVFGEIAARPPGARSVDIMNYGSDVDVYTGWAEAVCHGSFSQRVERKYNAIVIFKRAQGQGRIRRIVGFERLVREFGDWIVHVDLLPVGSRRRDWKSTLISDGYLVVRHPDLQTAMHMADRIGVELQLFAG